MLRALRVPAIVGVGVPLLSGFRDASCEGRGAQKGANKDDPLGASKVLRESFRPPETGAFVSGRLKVEHHLRPINIVQEWLSLVPPPGDAIPTVVRAKRQPDGRIEWLRAFDGKHFVASTWTVADDGAPISEEFGPLEFAQSLEITTAADVGERAVLCHTSSKLFGSIPFPTALMGVHCEMDVHRDGAGYDLRVSVLLMSLPLVSYTGALRCHDPGPAGAKGWWQWEPKPWPAKK